MSTPDQLLYSALHGTAMRYAAERRRRMNRLRTCARERAPRHPATRTSGPMDGQRRPSLEHVDPLHPWRPQDCDWITPGEHPDRVLEHQADVAQHSLSGAASGLGAVTAVVEFGAIRGY